MYHNYAINPPTTTPLPNVLIPCKKRKTKKSPSTEKEIFPQSRPSPKHFSFSHFPLQNPDSPVRQCATRIYLAKGNDL